jgi:flagellar motility protein MotE (MotC chaperone)
MKLLREFRIIPVVLFAAICLLSLKAIGILRGDGYILTDEPFLAETLTDRITGARSSDNALQPKSVAVSKIKQPLAQDLDFTGSVPDSKPATPPPAAKNAVDPPANPGGTPVMLDASKPSSPAERAILERLQERRQEIEARARELEVREGLVKAAEMRLEARVTELKAMEARVSAAMQAKDDADNSRFKGIVSMYENMKPKDAAKIFDRLDLSILVQVTNLINPRKMSDILGQMSAESAERLTVELANRAGGNDRPSSTAELPKIQGRPGG